MFVSRTSLHKAITDSHREGMILLLSRYLSKSRLVHYDRGDEKLYNTKNVKVPKVVDHYEEEGPCTTLTVWNKSLLGSCNGFAVIDSGGNLVYRVDNYMENPSEIVLMDGHGSSILTIRRRKRLNLRYDWLVYDDKDAAADHPPKKRKKALRKKNQLLQEKTRPICHVRKSVSSILQAMRHASNNVVLAHVFLDKMRSPAYVVEGSYRQRSCKISHNASRKVVAEIKRKEAAVNGRVALFSTEVFRLIVWPGFDPAFAMSIVLLLDQMFS